jgi:alpha-1,2-mannosyltransferase
MYVVNICVGKEWYRFPSNFFLPSSQYKLQFVESGFTGQLPKPYSAINGTWVIPTDMNDLNKQEMSRYVRTIFVVY